jgi:uncharacterized membrane protein
MCFTFKQSSGEGFLQPHFNWVNNQDSYFWFYVKNMGVPALLLIPAVLGSSKRNLALVAPLAVLMLIADTFQLQPNPYDNNKLIYPAYVLCIGVVADYMVKIYDKLKEANIGGRRVLAGGVIVACVFSGMLSMGREYVADEYEMLSYQEICAAEWIDKNTDGNDVVLTGPRYHNGITDLTGRSTVCSGEWFYSMHGLPDFGSRQQDVRRMYSDPVGSLALFEKYSVDYVYIGNEEKSVYSVNYDGLSAIATLVFNENGATVYKLNK